MNKIATVGALFLFLSFEVKANDSSMKRFTVQEFCTEHLRTIEVFITELEKSMTDREFLSDSGGFVCQCDPSTEPYLRLRCSSTSLAQNDIQSDSRNSANTTLSSLVETMEFALQEDSSYLPVSVQWCQYFDQLVTDSVYCESYQINPSTTLIESCSIEDTPCNNDPDSSVRCEACPGGQTIEATARCNDQDVSIFNCTANYMNSFLFAYQIENAVEVTRPVGTSGNDSTAVCQAGAVDAFCSSDDTDGLSAVESYLDQKALQIYTAYEMKENFKCRCITTTNGSLVSRLTLDCQGIMLDDQRQGESQNRLLTENLVLTVSDIDSFLTPQTMEWCDSGAEQGEDIDFFCESFEFGLGSTGFLSCQIDDCQASFCEICSDDLFIGHSCGGSASTCRSNGGESYHAPFLLSYRDLKLCPQTSASSASSVSNNGWVGLSLLIWCFGAR